MKSPFSPLFLWITLIALHTSARADSTIDSTEKHAYGANIGWINFKHDQPSAPEGAVTGLNFCSGFVYSANCGWIDLGDGSPISGIAYSNSSATDFGVNVASVDTSASPPVATLAGFAYGANIGWINFEATGNPRINLTTGEFIGFAYSANCGWINLGDANSHPALKTNTLETTDSDGDMIDDAWELQQAASAGKSAVLTHLGDTPGADFDKDGHSDLEEYRADTGPFDSSDRFRIINLTVRNDPTDNIDLEWSSSTNRIYEIGSDTGLDNFSTNFSNLAPDSGATSSLTFTGSSLPDAQFWRVGARLPLSP